MMRWTGRLRTDRSKGKAILIAGGALAASALLSLPQPAQAGRWGFDSFEVEGYRKTFKENDSEATKTEPYPAFPLYPGSSTASLPTTTLSVGPVAGVAASATQQATVRVVLKWTRRYDTDNPPDVVWLKINSSAGSEAVSDEQGSHRDAAKEHVSAEAAGKQGESAFSSNGTAKHASKAQLMPIVTRGQDVVKSRPLTLYASAAIDGRRVITTEYVDANGNTITEETPIDGSVTTGIGYTASFDDRRVWITSDLETKYKFPQPYLNRNTPDNKTYLGFLKRHYTMTATGAPLASFIGGVARYELSAKKADGTDIFDNQQYAWSATGSHQSIYVDPAASGDTWKEQDIAPSHPRKHLHLNFGNDWSDVVNTDGYTTSEIRAVATGDNSDLSSVEGQATVHWFSPKLLELAGTEIPDVDPADQAIEDYIEARKQVIEQGAGLTAGAYGMYGTLAESFLPDPTRGVVICFKAVGLVLRAGRNGNRFAGLLPIFKTYLLKAPDYDTVRGALIVKHNAHPKQTAERVADVLTQRGVPKVHPASKFAGKAPDDGVADDLASLMEGRAKHINEAAPVPGTGSLSGPQKTPRGDPGSTRYRSDVRENEAATTLKDQGYQIEQIPETSGSLDYRINGYEYDCYSPYHDPAYTQQETIEYLWNHVKTEKVDKGKTRVVLNLDDVPFPTSDVLTHMRNNPIAGMDDILVVKNNQIEQFWDFLQ